MIAESERGFNYTLTRDKLAMNLGSPPKKIKNVTPQVAAPPVSAAHETRQVSARDDRVAALEAQVANLTLKGVQDADRLATYEEEIRTLKTAANPRVDSPLGIIAAPPPPPPQQPLSRTSSITSGKFSFLTRTSSLTNTTKPLPKTPPKHSPMAPSSPAVTELQSQLAAETSKRLAAEDKLKDLEAELEDLSATLFEQANEMVAAERREKAKLEQRIKVLEERDRLGQKRLEMVEAALARIERVRKLLDG